MTLSGSNSAPSTTPLTTDITADTDVRPARTKGRLASILLSLALFVGLSAGALTVAATSSSAATIVTLQANTSNARAPLYVYRWVYFSPTNTYGWQQVSVSQQTTDAKGRFYVSVAAGAYYTWATYQNTLSNAGPCYIETYGTYVGVTGATASVTDPYAGINQNCY